MAKKSTVKVRLVPEEKTDSKFYYYAKKSTVKVRLVPEEKTDSKFYYYAKKPTSGLKAKDKLRMKKYNPATKKHEWFVEKKLPPHSK